MTDVVEYMGAQYHWTLAGCPVVGESVDRVRRYAPFVDAILVEGAPGTGKQGIAQLAHYARQCAGPLVMCDCPNVGSLADSDLFGHERGSFTGSLGMRRGKYEQASGGTVVLNDFNVLPPDVQTKLLGVLSERQFTRVGGTEQIPFNGLTVALGNEDMEELVKKEKLRRDLYSRLRDCYVYLPPLDQRTMEHRLAIIDALLHSFAVDPKFRGHHPLKREQIDQPVLEALLDLQLPENIRQLRRILRAMCIEAIGDNRSETVRMPHFDAALRNEDPKGTRSIKRRLRSTSHAQSRKKST